MNRKQVFIATVSAFLTLGILVAFSRPTGGNVRSVECIARATDLYTEEDITAAFDTIKSEFTSGFKGCTLHELRYDSEIEAQFLNETPGHRQEDAGNRIVVLSEFTTSWQATGDGFSPNDRYEDWQWILTRPSKNAPWKVDGWGY